MGTATRRGIEKALAKLKNLAAAKARSVPPAPFDEADWLAWFEQAGREGAFAREPDFPVALALLRDELANAKASIDPPFDPPEDFQPDQRHPHIRRENWRHAHHFPKLCEALDWLWEMLDRGDRGIPPVTEAEFADLAAWFAAHEKGWPRSPGRANCWPSGTGGGRGARTSGTSSGRGRGWTGPANSPRTSANSAPGTESRRSLSWASGGASHEGAAPADRIGPVSDFQRPHQEATAAACDGVARRVSSTHSSTTPTRPHSSRELP
jgi:hypothetical protein